MQLSSYNDFYGSNVDQKYRFDNILENKQFSKVKKILILFSKDKLF